jgi:AcrR family transcriptional regulator
LVAGAIATLAEAGYAAATAREIAGRANCNQALVFYHFGSVDDLLLAALDEVSVRRFAAYREIVERAGSLAELIESARTVFSEDLAAGYVAVLAEMITAAQSRPKLGAEVSARLAPWREFAHDTVGRSLRGSPLALVLPATEVAHGVVAGLLGLELLAGLDEDPGPALALFDLARSFAALVEATAGGFAPFPAGEDQP